MVEEVNVGDGDDDAYKERKKSRSNFLFFY
jgi:hypothetical protein